MPMTKVKHLWQYNLHQDEAQKKKKKKSERHNPTSIA